MRILAASLMLALCAASALASDPAAGRRTLTPDDLYRVLDVSDPQLYQSLRTLGVPAQLVIYPGEHHVFTRPSFVEDLADRMSAWLDRFVPATP
jgi:hypothetical protein